MFHSFFKVPRGTLKKSVTATHCVKWMTNGFQARVLLKMQTKPTSDSGVDMVDTKEVEAHTISSDTLYARDHRTGHYRCFGHGTNVTWPVDSRPDIFVGVDPGHHTIMSCSWKLRPDRKPPPHPPRHGSTRKRQRRRRWRRYQQNHRHNTAAFSFTNKQWKRWTGGLSTRKRCVACVCGTAVCVCVTFGC